MQVVLTGCILYVYLYEMLVRLYGFRLRVFTMPLELCDFAIIVTSVVVFIIVLSSVRRCFVLSSMAVLCCAVL